MDNSGGGIWNGFGGMSTLINCIIRNNRSNGSTNTPAASIGNSSSSKSICSYSIIANSCGSNNWVSSIGTDNGNNKDQDPLFVMPVDLMSLPTSAGDLRLSESSPAIDMGDVSALPGGLTTDLNGELRVQGVAMDMEPYEGAVLSCTDVAVLYVDSAATGGNTGLSWEDAFISLQDALLYPSDFDSIFVAKGTYYPDESNGGRNDRDERTTSFVIPDSVVLLGGFNVAFGDTTPDSRNLKCNRTILSGDLTQIVSPGNLNFDNSYHIVGTTNVSAATVIDGFVIEYGRPCRYRLFKKYRRRLA